MTNVSCLVLCSVFVPPWSPRLFLPRVFSPWTERWELTRFVLFRTAHSCPCCGRGFSRNDNLQQHLRVHKDYVPSKAIMPNTYRQQPSP